MDFTATEIFHLPLLTGGHVLAFNAVDPEIDSVQLHVSVLPVRRLVL